MGESGREERGAVGDGGLGRECYGRAAGRKCRPATITPTSS
jgi:hypothetical protein